MNKLIFTPSALRLSFNEISKPLLVALIAALTACSAVETHRKVESTRVESYGTSYYGPKTTLVVDNFENRSNYMQGLFSGNTDRLGNQSKTILKASLQQTNRFSLVDRENMQGNAEEAKLAGLKQKLKGARYTIGGAVTEFGRKVTGDHQLFGILGSGKKQVAYAKVTLTLIDVLTSEIIYSTQGAGEFALSDREALGFGTRAGYDATLNGKVLNFAIQEAVNAMVRDLEQGRLNLEAGK